MRITNKVYDVIKWIVTIVIPAIITLYATLGNVWNLPYVEQITATLAAINVFLGAVIQISSSNYNKTYDGILHVDTVSDEESDKYLFEIDDLDDIIDKDKITLKINNTQFTEDK